MGQRTVGRFLEQATRAQLETYSKRLLLEVPRRGGVEALRQAIAAKLKVRLTTRVAPRAYVRVSASPPRAQVSNEVFAAIDFETATTQPDSACAVAVVRVEGGQVVAKRSMLLRPPRASFAFTHVHGLTWAMVREAPSFAEAWPQFRPMLLGIGRLWAHNESFDRSVLEACCAAARLSAPVVQWACSMRLARRVWGFSRPNLASVTGALGIPLCHHEAGSDAEACARIVLRAMKEGLLE